MLRRPLRIVQILAGPYPTRQGSQVYVRGMTQALARRGHQVHLVCYGHGEGPILDHDGPVILHRAPSLPGYRNLRAGPDAVKPLLDLALLAMLWRLAPQADLFHAHNYEAPLAALPAAVLRGVPLVYNAHNTMAEELPTYFEGLTRRALAARVGARLDLNVPRRAHAAIGISRAGARALSELGCARVYHLPPGVDLAELQGANAENARSRYHLGGRLWVIYAGNPDAYQDLDVLIEAMGRLPELGLIMVSASTLDEWESSAEAAGIGAERRRFVRTSEWEEARDLMAASDIAALPRAVCSGFPIKLLNYLGIGLPTVVARGSAVEIAGTTTVPNHDPVAFAEALRALAQDREKRLRLGREGRDEVARRWSWDARVLELEEAYDEILSLRDQLA